MPSGVDEAKLLENIARVRDRIVKAASSAGRNPDEVTLVAVSKTRTALECTSACMSGMSILGENRVQEAREKIAPVREILQSQGHVEPQWRLIGHLQSNKARDAVNLFHSIDSIDDFDLASEISKRALTLDKRIECLLEVNTSGEASKYGCMPEETTELWEKVSSLPNLELRGLMTIGPLSTDEQQVRSAFALLRGLSERIQSSQLSRNFILSMGMSDDMEWAIAEGSTMVRVGSAIFGNRILH